MKAWANSSSIIPIHYHPHRHCFLSAASYCQNIKVSVLSLFFIWCLLIDSELLSTSPVLCPPFLLLPSLQKWLLFCKRGDKFHPHHHCNRCHHSRSIYSSPSSRVPHIKHSTSSLQWPLHYVPNSKSCSQPYITIFGCTSELMMAGGIECFWLYIMSHARVTACTCTHIRQNECVHKCTRAREQTCTQYITLFWTDQWFFCKGQCFMVCHKAFLQPPAWHT